jgi:hypothetical protein
VWKKRYRVGIHPRYCLIPSKRPLALYCIVCTVDESFDLQICFRLGRSSCEYGCHDDVSPNEKSWTSRPLNNTSLVPSVESYLASLTDMSPTSDSICGKVSRALYMLRTCKNFLSHAALKTLYYSLVHCHLVYGNQIWSAASSGVLTGCFVNKKLPFE